MHNVCNAKNDYLIDFTQLNRPFWPWICERASFQLTFCNKSKNIHQDDSRSHFIWDQPYITVSELPTLKDFLRDDWWPCNIKCQSLNDSIQNQSAVLDEMIRVLKSKPFAEMTIFYSLLQSPSFGFKLIVYLKKLSINKNII